MKKERFFWAIAFGSMLAMSGCGSSDSGGTGGTGGGGSSSGFCGTLCDACGGDQVADCESSCGNYLSGGALGGINLDSCPGEAQAWGACLGANNCDSGACDTEITAWATCLATQF
ncbi:MAG: hypothetical protein WCF10_04615 [Polyangiales bacterium]